METVGTRITHLLPAMAFIAEAGGSTKCTLVYDARLPVSTTHSIVGAIFGVGLVFGRQAIDVRTVRDIVLAWAATPAAAGVELVLLVFYTILCTHFLTGRESVGNFLVGWACGSSSECCWRPKSTWTKCWRSLSLAEHSAALLRR